jgi:hypothetical protein
LGYTGTDTGAGGGTDSGNTGGGTDNGNTGGGTDSGNTGGGTDTGGGTTGGGTTGGGWVDNGGVVDNGIVGPGFCDNDTGICQAVSAEAISPPDVAGRTYAQVQIIFLAVLFLALLLTFPVLSLIRRGKNT